MAALGVGSRPASTRTLVRSASIMRCHVPSSRQAAKSSYRQLLGGKSFDKLTHSFA
jgi:hypothetical protein